MAQIARRLRVGGGGVKGRGEGAGDEDGASLNSPADANSSEAGVRHRAREPRAGSRGSGHIHRVCCRQDEGM